MVVFVSLPHFSTCSSENLENTPPLFGSSYEEFAQADVMMRTLSETDILKEMYAISLRRTFERIVSVGKGAEL